MSVNAIRAEERPPGGREVPSVYSQSELKTETGASSPGPDMVNSEVVLEGKAVNHSDALYRHGAEAIRCSANGGTCTRIHNCGGIRGSLN